MRKLYNFFWWILTPVVLGFMALRWRRGKEHKTRYPERFGLSPLARPQGKLIWMHGASVGEVLSLLPLISTLREHHPDITLLITSGTVTSAALVQKRLGSTVIHQFIPLDHPLFCGRFLNRWRPDAIYWVESDLWVGMLGAVKKRAIPAFLINARMSEKSYRRWRLFPAWIRQILSVFSVMLTADPGYQERFQVLSGQNVVVTPDLKYDAPLAQVSEEQRQGLVSFFFNGVPLWMAASTHDPEEGMIFGVHQRLKQAFPTLRLILAPRHPHRRDSVRALAESLGLSVALRSAGEDPTKDIYLVDTMGEMDLFYSLSPIVFVGGSLISHGGQNVFEPARQGCAVLHGPHMDNFPRMCADLGDGLIPVQNTDDLFSQVHSLLSDPAALASQQEKARNKAKDLRGAAAMIYERTHAKWL